MSDEMPGEAVQVAGPEFSDGVTVCGRTVTLVVGPFIGFILGLRSQFDHEPVSRDFGDDGCGGHGAQYLSPFTLVETSAGTGTSGASKVFSALVM